MRRLPEKFAEEIFRVSRTAKVSNRGKLFSLEFLFLNLVTFFAFCNMAVFYSFFNYLSRIDIPVEWRGFLVGLEPMSAFMLRLFVVPILHVGNAASAMLIALCMLVAALFSYGWVVSTAGIAIIRIFHGAAFVLLVSASMALVVNFIPKERSAQGFGFVSVSVLIPYAMMPPVTEYLLRFTQNEAQIYRLVTVLALPAFFLLIKLRRRLSETFRGMSEGLVRRPTAEEMRRNLKEPGIILLLAVNLLVYLCYASVFFFMKGHAAASSIGQVGGFFTITTVVMIVLRLWGGASLDKFNKTRMLSIFMFLLAPCFVLFGMIDNDLTLWLLGGYYGVCMGLIMPMLSALLFEISPPHLRGVNTNLGLFVMDAGYFLSPYAGGLFIAKGHSFASLFDICAAFILVSFFLLLLLGTLKKSSRKNMVRA